MSFPPGTEMFQFPGFAFHALWIQAGMTLAGRVSPFGNPRIKDCSHLPAAYRRVPRPSSPLGAKASTKCPSRRLLSLRGPSLNPEGIKTRAAQLRVRHKDTHRNPANCRPASRSRTTIAGPLSVYLSDLP